MSIVVGIIVSVYVIHVAAVFKWLILYDLFFSVTWITYLFSKKGNFCIAAALDYFIVGTRKDAVRSWKGLPT